MKKGIGFFIFAIASVFVMFGFACSTGEGNPELLGSTQTALTYEPPSSTPDAAPPVKAGCEVTIQYWVPCPQCEVIKAKLPTWRTKYPCLNIKYEESKTPIEGGYPRIKDMLPTCGLNCIEGYITSLAETCGCNQKTGRCFCKSWTGSTERGYQCAAPPASIQGELPSCDKVDECAMSYEECDKLRAPGLCEKLECKNGRSPRCQIVKDTKSKQCDKVCSEVEVCGAPTVPGGPPTCKKVPDCSDSDCCSMLECIGDPACKGTTPTTGTVTPDTDVMPRPM